MSGLEVPTSSAVRYAPSSMSTVSPKSSSRSRRASPSGGGRAPGKHDHALAAAERQPRDGRLEGHRAREAQGVADRRQRVVVGPHAAAAERRTARGRRADGGDRAEPGARATADEQCLVRERFGVRDDGEGRRAHAASPSVLSGGRARSRIGGRRARRGGNPSAAGGGCRPARPASWARPASRRRAPRRRRRAAPARAAGDVGLGDRRGLVLGCLGSGRSGGRPLLGMLLDALPPRRGGLRRLPGVDRHVAGQGDGRARGPALGTAKAATGAAARSGASRCGLVRWRDLDRSAGRERRGAHHGGDLACAHGRHAAGRRPRRRRSPRSRPRRRRRRRRRSRAASRRPSPAGRRPAG